MKNIRSWKELLEDESMSSNSTLNKNLLKAVERDDVEWAKGLIAHGADVNMEVEYFNNLYIYDRLLHFCASWGFTDMARLLIDSGAEVDARDETGRTALHISASSGYDAVTDVLLDAGAEVDAQNNVGSTPLRGAVFMGNMTISKKLIKRGADPLKVFTDPLGIVEFFEGDIDWMPEDLKRQIKLAQRSKKMFGV